MIVVCLVLTKMTPYACIVYLLKFESWKETPMSNNQRTFAACQRVSKLFSQFSQNDTEWKHHSFCSERTLSAGLLLNLQHLRVFTYKNVNFSQACSSHYYRIIFDELEVLIKMIVGKNNYACTFCIQILFIVKNKIKFNINQVCR